MPAFSSQQATAPAWLVQGDETRAAVISDPDVFRSAKLHVEQHGDEVAIHAAMKAEAMLDEGDLGGRAVWLRILKAVTQLLPDKARNSAKVHGSASQACASFGSPLQRPSCPTT